MARSSPARLRVGVVSDTHGHFDPRLRELFAGCDLVLHAGDVVDPAILRELAALAPVRAVRGNNDLGPALEALPEIASVPLGELTALVVHALGSRVNPAPSLRRALAHHRPQVLVHGHSHRPSAELADGVLLLNPGSAGPRRFSLPRAAATLAVRGRVVEARLVDLASPGLAPLAPPLVAPL